VRRTYRRQLLAILAGVLVWAAPAQAERVRVAVASNFAIAAERLVTEFAASSEHEVQLIAGSTGKLYAQIVRGAPFDVFLAADAARPARLVEDGLAIAESRRTYALGRLVLWSADPDERASLGPEVLRMGAFRRLAIANPDLAPYGVASGEALASLGIARDVAPRLVYGENIGQAYALVASGNADLGFVARSQVVQRGDAREAGWAVPASHHTPIRQELVLLSRAAGNTGAQAFVTWLASDAARATIRAAGYEVD